MKKIYFLGFLLLVFFKLANAQNDDKKLISVNFQQAKIEQVASELESKTGYHFYYNPAQFDSLKVTLQATDKSLEAILYMAFNKTDFHFAITQQQQVFLTKGREIRTELASGFFNTQPTAANAPQQPAVVDYTEDKQKKIPEATTENKLYEIGIRTNTIKPGTANLAGYVKNAKSGEGIIGAS
ncbi:MAG: TonB-dependent receptor, partial [Mucilaginibacter sp.]|nr:TonB-dependent receptor [Mucilaginibacter sp.]